MTVSRRRDRRRRGALVMRVGSRAGDGAQDGRRPARATGLPYPRPSNPAGGGARRAVPACPTMTGRALCQHTEVPATIRRRRPSARPDRTGGSTVDRFEPNLRIPGPTGLPPTVREAGARQMINHRGPEFAAMLARILDGHEAVLRDHRRRRDDHDRGHRRARGGGRQHAVARRSRPRRLDRLVRRPVRQDRRRPTART